MSEPAPLFRFCQVELPWPLGPPDGRYLLRASHRELGPAVLADSAPTRPERNLAQPDQAPDRPDLARTRPERNLAQPDQAPGRPESEPSHVLVFSTLGARPHRRLDRARSARKAEPEPEPEPVTTSRATVIDVGDPLADPIQARAWLQTAGEPDLLSGLEILNHALNAFRLASADPYLNVVGRDRLLVARIGVGAGEQVADGLWTDAFELVSAGGRQRRARMLAPQAGFAAILAGRRRTLVCEELTLRARLDVDQGHDRRAALQILVALDATLAELPLDPAAAVLAERLSELRGRRDAVVDAGQAALAGPVSDAEREAVLVTLSRIEAALRARAVAAGG